MEQSRLNDFIWKIRENQEFREQVYAKGPVEVLRSYGIPEDQIQAFINQDISKLLALGLIPRSSLRWGTFWLNILVDRARRGKKFTVEDVLRLQEI